jgi:hypothetical protein
MIAAGNTIFLMATNYIAGFHQPTCNINIKHQMKPTLPELVKK